MNRKQHRKLCNECFEVLSSHGVDIDHGVTRLIELFFATEKHMEFSDFERLARENDWGLEGPAIRKAVRLLVEYGFAVEKTFIDGRIVYEHLHTGEHHDHFYCLRCGKLTEFFSPALEDLQCELALTHHFHPFSHRLQINGLCGECFGQVRNKLIPLSSVLPGAVFRIVETLSTNVRGGLGRGSMRRLAEVGLTNGSRGEVISNQGLMLVVLIGSNRLALRKGQARKVLVSVEEKTTGTAHA